MWIITHYLDSYIKMFEFETEEEAKITLKKIKGYKILSEIVYFTDSCFPIVTD
ncbi:hypothetical protein NDK43_08930 [Neobacillus pocheonensis]|uniref:Uncharacterized protein n=1 Tax=Neobacillus pocheonensis TaxID=363869 RepID=A0ABT0W838_9BACI|nr:hypothetical protein [Neobacillus pocheonensis]